MSIPKVPLTVCQFPVPKLDMLSGFFACLQDFRPFQFTAIGDWRERRHLYGIPSVGFIHRSVLVAQFKTHLRDTVAGKIVAHTAWRASVYAGISGKRSIA